jgi:hypothetical protein
MSGSGLDIQKRAVTKRTQEYRKKKGGVTKYPRYQVNIPAEFAIKHNLEKKGLYIVADQIWFGIPDEKDLMKILPLIPQIKELIKDSNFSESDVRKLLELHPEMIPLIIKVMKESKVPTEEDK